MEAVTRPGKGAMTVEPVPDPRISHPRPTTARSTTHRRRTATSTTGWSGSSSGPGHPVAVSSSGGLRQRAGCP